MTGSFEAVTDHPGCLVETALGGATFISPHPSWGQRSEAFSAYSLLPEAKSERSDPAGGPDASPFWVSRAGLRARQAS